jgi:hypothetical protein
MLSALQASYIVTPQQDSVNAAESDNKVSMIIVTLQPAHYLGPYLGVEAKSFSTGLPVTPR